MRATCTLVTQLCQPLLQAWGGSLSPHDRLDDLGLCPSHSRPFEFAKEGKKKKKALDKFQVDKNQMPLAYGSMRTDVELSASCR